MKKKEAIRRWANTEENLPILEHFTPLAADAKGSTFGACSIRISGNSQFIDAVLSHLKECLDAEAGTTRLAFGRMPVQPVKDKKWSNADTGAEVCYLQIRERTARTRQRKVAQATEPLPTIDIAPDAPTKPATAKPSATKPNDGFYCAEINLDEEE